MVRVGKAALAETVKQRTSKAPEECPTLDFYDSTPTPTGAGFRYDDPKTITDCPATLIDGKLFGLRFAVVILRHLPMVPPLTFRRFPKTHSVAVGRDAVKMLRPDSAG